MSIEAMKQAIEALEAVSMEMTVGERYTNAGQQVLDAIELLRVATTQQPATGEPVGYMNEGHIHELAMRRLPYGYVYPEAGAGASTAVYTHPSPCEPSLIEKAISSGWFGVLPVKATIPMCKAGWGASGGELTFQQIGHIYEEMYKARPLPDDAIYAAPSVPDGYVLVPIEPTQAMMNVQTWDFSSFYSPREIWAAMLAAKDSK